MVRKARSKKSKPFAGVLSKKGLAQVKRTAARKAQVKVMRKIAKAEIHRMAEDFEFMTVPTNLAIGGGPVQYLSTPWENNCCIDVNDLLLDNINQGTNQSQRIGNRVRLRRCVWKAIFSAYRDPVSGAYNYIPAELKITVLSSIVNPNSAVKSDIRTICANSLYQANAASIGMTSSLIDFLRAYNKDQVRIYKTRTYKIGGQNYPQSTPVVGNNDFKFNAKCTINLGKYMNKIIKYDDSPSDARNKKIFIVLEAVPADQSVGSTTPLVSMTNYLHMKYEDI